MLRVGAVGAVDGDPQAGEVGAEALDDVLEVAVGRDADPVDRRRRLAPERRAAPRSPPPTSSVSLLPVAVEELDAVVLGRVVRGRDDDAEVEREQRHRRGRQDAGEHGVAARGDDAARERLLELRAGAARVAADEDAAAAGPERRRLAEPLDELGGQVLADDAPDAVRAEVPAQEPG